MKCPNTGLFLVRIFLHLDWIRRLTVNLRIQSEYRKIRTRNNSAFGHFSHCLNQNIKQRKRSIQNAVKHLKMELFAKTVNSFAKSFILEAWLVSKYAPEKWEIKTPKCKAPMWIFKSRRTEVFCNKCALKNFEIFHSKTSVLESIF